MHTILNRKKSWAEEKLARFCDVFCETGVFTAEETEQILTAGLRHGLKAKVHADEIDPIGGSQLAGRLPAISAEHLICTPDAGIASMAEGGTVAEHLKLRIGKKQIPLRICMMK